MMLPATFLTIEGRTVHSLKEVKASECVSDFHGNVRQKFQESEGPK